MNRIIYRTAAAVALTAGIQGVAQADAATTAGGLQIKSEDGNFEARIGGRIHVDGSLIDADNDTDSLGLSHNGGKNSSGFYFRRVFLTLTGKAYGWDYHFDEDFVGGNTSVTTTTDKTTGDVTSVKTSGGAAAGFQEVWIGHEVFGNDHLYIGQHKPWRSLDEIASNNNTPLMERNILSKNGLFGGRDYTQGLYYKYANRGFWAGGSFYTDGKAGSTTGRSFGGNLRFAYAPIVGKTAWLHTGLTYSYDNISPDGDGFGKIAPGYSTWYAYKGTGATLVSFSGAAGNNVNAGTGTVELAGAYGPAYLQAEYGATHQWEQLGKAASVDAYSATIAYAITGETRPYDSGSASYGGIKPAHRYGAVELAVRYDSGKNRDDDTCALNSKDTATKCSISAITAGVNYYVNPNVRFMLDYEHGKADDGVAQDTPSAVMGRAQFVF